ncbi:MAG: hypothetical protein QME07_05680 [bacterium]|nr:hypothetical protein [bacterium]
MKKRNYFKSPLVNVNLNVISPETNQSVATSELIRRFGYHTPRTIVPKKIMTEKVALSALVTTYEYRLEEIEDSFGVIICKVSLERLPEVKTEAILHPYLPENEMILGSDLLLHFLTFFKGRKDFSSQASSFISLLNTHLTDPNPDPFLIIES